MNEQKKLEVNAPKNNEQKSNQPKDKAPKTSAPLTVILYLDGHKVLHGLSTVPTEQYTPALGRAPKCVEATIDVLYGYPVFGDMSVTAKLEEDGTITGTEGYLALDAIIIQLAELEGYPVK